MPFRDKGAVLLDFDGRIVFASTYVCDLVGVEHDKIHEMTCFDFVFPEDMKAARHALEALKSPNAAPFRARLRRADATPIWADVRGTPIRPADGDIYAITATVTAVESHTRKQTLPSQS